MYCLPGYKTFGHVVSYVALIFKKLSWATYVAFLTAN
jgi:hypothetical protein